MRQNEGGTKVKGGFYLSRKNWELVTVSGKQGLLPGKPGEKYVKVPTLLMLAAAPIYGGAFVIFLPLIGFTMLFGVLARKVAHATVKAVHPAEPAQQKSR